MELAGKCRRVQHWNQKTYFIVLLYTKPVTVWVLICDMRAIQVVNISKFGSPFTKDNFLSFDLVQSNPSPLHNVSICASSGAN